MLVVFWDEDPASGHLRDRSESFKSPAPCSFTYHVMKVGNRRFATCCTCDTQATGQGPDWAPTSRSAPQRMMAESPCLLMLRGV